MNVVILKAGEGRMLPLGPIQMVVQEDGTHTRGTLGVAAFEVAPHAPTPPPLELIPEAGHLPQLEQPERLLTLVWEFADSITATPSAAGSFEER